MAAALQYIQEHGLTSYDALEAQTTAAEKKAFYAEYHAVQRDMRDALTVKTNIDHLLGITTPDRDKEQVR